jgi:hypothetical protein
MSAGGKGNELRPQMERAKLIAHSGAVFFIVEPEKTSEFQRRLLAKWERIVRENLGSYLGKLLDKLCASAFLGGKLESQMLESPRIRQFRYYVA